MVPPELNLNGSVKMASWSRSFQEPPVKGSHRESVVTPAFDIGVCWLGPLEKQGHKSKLGKLCQSRRTGGMQGGKITDEPVAKAPPGSL
jgi:hypothetical protein